MTAEIVTAAILVIGDEILSGRTKDKNIGYIAEYMTAIGIDVKEVRVVSDDEPEVIAALNALHQGAGNTCANCQFAGGHAPGKPGLAHALTQKLQSILSQ